MLRKPLRAGAAVIGGAVLATTMLAGCAGQPKLMYQGMEIASLDKGLESMDKAWADNRTNGAASNIDKESRCYAQVNEDNLAEKAICGPIHYLGEDQAVWESAAWQPSGEGKDKVQVSPGGSFSKDTPAANTELYRTDGKKAPESFELTEPDTETAASTQAIWGVGLSSTGEPKTVTVVTPESTITVKDPRVSDRVGSASDRVKAGDGHKFASAQLEVQGSSSGDDSQSVLSELAFVSGGKSYPLGKAKSGSVAMAVPGDGSDIALAVTYEGLTQTVTFGDAKLQSKATAFYDNFSTSTGLQSQPDPVVIGNREAGNSAEITMSDLTATRTAYDPKAGWAPEGKAWLVLKANVKDGDPSFRGTGGEWGSYTANYETVVKVSSAAAKNISGTAFTAKLARTEVIKDDEGWFAAGNKVTVVFEVPANVGDFSVDLAFNSAGAKKSGEEPKAPATISVDASFKGLELVFDKKK